jgi:hypothetical protein
MTASGLKSDMQKAGFTKVATNLALSDLLQRGYIERKQGLDANGEPYSLYLTDDGIRRLSRNRDQLVLTRATRAESSIADENIPF